MVWILIVNNFRFINIIDLDYRFRFIVYLKVWGGLVGVLGCGLFGILNRFLLFRSDI